jgi:hypothetical protein
LLKRLLKFLSARPVATGAVRLGLLGTSVGAGVIINGTPAVADPGTANLWLEAGAGSCTRVGNPGVNYGGSGSPDARCGNFDTACSAAQRGDTILAVDNGGAFGGQQIDRSECPATSGTSYVTFRGASGESPQVAGSVQLGSFQSGTDAPDYIAWDNIDITNGSFQANCGAGTCAARIMGLKLLNSVVKDASSGGDLVSWGSYGDVTIAGNEIGPGCCETVGIAFGKGGPSYPTNTDIVIRDNYIHDLYDSCTQWPGDLGSCSGTGFGDACGSCRHIDGIQLVDAHTILIERNRLYSIGGSGGSGQGIFFGSDTGGYLENATIINNMVGRVPGGQEEVPFGSNCDGFSPGCIRGYLRLLYNTVDGNINIYGNNIAAGTEVTVVGNIANDEGIGVGGACTGLAYDGSALNPTYRNNLNQARSCDASDTLGTTTFVSSTRPMDLRLATSAANAVDLGEAVYCGSGKTVAVDLFGVARFLGSACDRGANEKG